MADRYSEDRFFGPGDEYQVRGVARSGTPDHSSAREYYAAGVNIGKGPEFHEPAGNREEYRAAMADREDRYGDRSFFERAGDELRSWFGDEEAERRRSRDMRRDERLGRHHDSEYSAWRRERIRELDRDYDEYRRENAQRFHNEFTAWRNDRQGQRDGLRRVGEHMEVVGSDGVHVGTVDKVRGDRILLTRNDSDSGGHHHSIPSRWIEAVGDKVVLRKTADEARSAWKDEENAGAFFGDERADSREWQGDHHLNRSFRGTY